MASNPLFYQLLLIALVLLCLLVHVGLLDGSDIHVMLALRGSSRQVVMTNKQLDGANMMGELCGE
jgi:hypothetical protein